jgi:hypothetical protein
MVSFPAITKYNVFDTFFIYCIPPLAKFDRLSRNSLWLLQKIFESQIVFVFDFNPYLPLSLNIMELLRFFPNNFQGSFFKLSSHSANILVESSSALLKPLL